MAIYRFNINAYFNDPITLNSYIEKEKNEMRNPPSHVWSEGGGVVPVVAENRMRNPSHTFAVRGWGCCL